MVGPSPAANAVCTSSMSFVEACLVTLTVTFGCDSMNSWMYLSSRACLFTSSCVQNSITI